jgi:hypothetical protein
MLIMPELQELGGELAPPLSMVHLEVHSLGPLVVASTPPHLVLGQPLVLVDSKVIFAKELCDLVVSLASTSPEFIKDI